MQICTDVTHIWYILYMKKMDRPDGAPRREIALVWRVVLPQKLPFTSRRFNCSTALVPCITTPAPLLELWVLGRQAAAQSLGQLGNPGNQEVIQQLLQCLQDMLDMISGEWMKVVMIKGKAIAGWHEGWWSMIPALNTDSTRMTATRRHDDAQPLRLVRLFWRTPRSD